MQGVEDSAPNRDRNTSGAACMPVLARYQANPVAACQASCQVAALTGGLLLGLSDVAQQPALPSTRMQPPNVATSVAQKKDGLADVRALLGCCNPVKLSGAHCRAQRQEMVTACALTTLTHPRPGGL